MPSVLFVCTGNICRSPMAEALFGAWLKRQAETGEWVVASAGTWATDGVPASRHAQTMMAERGLSLTRHRSRHITASLMNAADLVVCMTRSHQEALRAEFPGRASRIRLLSEAVGQVFDVEDPYGGSREAYAAVAADLEDLVERGGEQLAAWARGEPGPGGERKTG